MPRDMNMNHAIDSTETTVKKDQSEEFSPNGSTKKSETINSGTPVK